MGYDLARFVGTVDEELICPICSGVLENPFQVCFCFAISLWLVSHILLGPEM